MSKWRRRCTTCLLAGAGFGVANLHSQALPLPAARARAIETSPDLVAARAAVDAATARQQQSDAFPNPVLSYAREQTSGGGLTNWQNIALFEQRLDVGGQRGARREAANLRRQAALARLAVRETELSYEVTRAYAAAVAADQRAAQAAEAARAFIQARRITAERLASGDVSGYASHRVSLEAARYAALRAQTELARRAARLALGTLLGLPSDSVMAVGLQLEAVPPVAYSSLLIDSLQALALRSRGELRIAEAELAAAAADARTARREAFPGPLAGLGFKNERAAGATMTTTGFVLQLSLPVPLWDGRHAAAAAFDAEGRERAAEDTRLRRNIIREVEVSLAALRAVEEQIGAIGPQLGAAARTALRAVEAAYAEGEVSLVEWLDAVRAYEEAESSFAMLRSEQVIQRAALERAVGARLN